MVRHKKRWLLVHLYFESSPPIPAQQQQKLSRSFKKKGSLEQLETKKRLADDEYNGARLVTQKELHIQLRESFLSCFGVAGSAAASHDTQGM
jgi:hypothetical protein